MLWMLLLACQEPDAPGIVTLLPEIAVTPDAVAFGDVGVPLVASTSFWVSNAGRVDLDVVVALEGDDVFDLPVTQATIAPDDQLALDVLFAPASYLDYAAELVITSNDEDNPEVRVPVAGRGVSAPLPDIQLDRATLDFGEVDDLAQDILRVRNVGTAPLNLGAARLEGSGAFSLLTDPSATTVAAGNELPVVLLYAPQHTDGDNGRLVLPSDDPDEPEVVVQLLGNGGGDFAYPEARIACPGQTDPPRFVPLDGSGSIDPNGLLPLSYAWSLVAVPEDPFGRPTSSGYLTSLAGPQTSLFADAVGSYEVQLVVTNAAGTRSAPARCFIDAIPDEQIVVELTWDTPNADLDLHVAQGDAALFERPGDVSYCNQTPDWGQIGVAVDNPRLDLDDRAGFGPENVNIDEPAHGTYVVRVHYYNDQGDDTVAATVRVFLGGDLTPAFQDSQLLDRNEVWDAASIRWPEATAGALSVEPGQAAHRQCFTP